jgi:hypothetical protein
MKTKVRTEISNSNVMGTAYKHMHIQILTGRYNSKDDSNLEPMGKITFQSNINEPAGYSNWYGMTFVIETDRPDYIKRMAQLAKFIKDKRSDYNAQPNEILELIGAEGYVFYDNVGFIPIKANGMNLYKVFSNYRFYTSIIAEDEAAAQKQLAKKKIADSSLQFEKVITF